MATRADWSRCPPAPCGPRGGSGTVRHMRRAAAHPAPSAPSHRQNQVRRGSIEEDARQTADVQRSRSGTEQMEMISSCPWCLYACIIQTFSAIGPYTFMWEEHCTLATTPIASLCGPHGSIQAVRDAGEVVVHVMYRQQASASACTRRGRTSSRQSPPKDLWRAVAPVLRACQATQTVDASGDGVRRATLDLARLRRSSRWV